ncbi:MAG: hypothetical protein WAU91_06925 [Desulfatitalea sp.]
MILIQTGKKTAVPSFQSIGEQMAGEAIGCDSADLDRPYDDSLAEAAAYDSGHADLLFADNAESLV